MDHYTRVFLKSFARLAMASYEERNQARVASVLKAPCQLLLTNIHKSVISTAVIQANLPNANSYECLELHMPGTRTAFVRIRFRNIDDAKKVVEELMKAEDWSWNAGFKIRFKGLMTLSAKDDGSETGASCNGLGIKSLDFFGDCWDDAIEELRPGCVLMLPPFKHRKGGIQMDIHLPDEWYGHPVMIVHNHAPKRLVNFVRCTSFRGRNIKDVHLYRPEDLPRWVEVDSRTTRTERERDEKAGKEPARTDILRFTGNNQLQKRTYASVDFRTADPGALIRLSRDFITGIGWDNIPGGYLQVSNIEVLLDRIVKITKQHVYPGDVATRRPTTRAESALEREKRGKLEAEKSRERQAWYLELLKNERKWAEEKLSKERLAEEKVAEQLAIATLNETARDLKPKGTSESTENELCHS